MKPMLTLEVLTLSLHNNDFGLKLSNLYHLIEHKSL